MTDASAVVPAGWYACEAIATSVEGTVLGLELVLSARQYFRRHVLAQLDLNRKRSRTSILLRIFDAAYLELGNESHVLHGRALRLHLSIERGRNVVVDAKPLTSRGRR
jgi:hypothetical protein